MHEAANTSSPTVENDLVASLFKLAARVDAGVKSAIYITPDSEGDLGITSSSAPMSAHESSELSRALACRVENSSTIDTAAVFTARGCTYLSWTVEDNPDSAHLLLQVERAESTADHINALSDVVAIYRTLILTQTQLKDQRSAIAQIRHGASGALGAAINCLEGLSHRMAVYRNHPSKLVDLAASINEWVADGLHYARSAYNTLEMGRYLFFPTDSHELHWGNVDVVSVVNSVVATLSSEMKRRRLDVVSSVRGQQATAPYVVLADRNMLSLVIFNLIDNAVKYSSVATRIHIDIDELSDDRWKFSVRNVGAPLDFPDPNVLNVVPWRRTVQKGMRAGSGLGLATSAAILKAHDSGVKFQYCSDVVSTNHREAVTTFYFEMSKAHISAVADRPSEADL
jgi:hypothetical protein